MRAAVIARKVFSINEIFKSYSAVNKIIMPFYAVAKGRTTGIFMTWPDCEIQVKSFPGARYKKFNTVVEAQDFITANSESSASHAKNSQNNTKSLNLTSNNRKRSYSSSNNVQHTPLSTQSQKLSTSSLSNKESDDNGDDARFSDDSDDLNAILSKQMDDIEKRLKTFEKGVDKIIKKSKKTILIEPPQNKRQKTSGGGELVFDVDDDGFVKVYTDGSCTGNGTSGARAGLGVYWGNDHPLNISEPVSGRATNNCGEIQAATKAIKQALQNKIKKLSIYTDSKFLINSITKWMPAWKKKGWKLKSGEPVKNQIDFKDLDSVVHKLQIKWNYIEAHAGLHGNEMADRLAKDGAARYNR